MNAAMIRTRLPELLEQRGKTLYWLSKQTETAYSTIHKLSTAKTDAISFRVLEAICRALDCKPGDVLEIVPDEPAS